MNFNEILAKLPETDQKTLLEQAINKRNYNRAYQAKLRLTAKQLTIERKIDNDVLHAIGYIKSKYALELKNYEQLTADILNAQAKSVVPVIFQNWLLVCGANYKDAEQAHSVSDISKDMPLDQFTKLFNLYFIQEGDRYILRES